MSMKGIDVSNSNGTVDWNAAKAAGAQFAILRLGYGEDLASQDDKQFERNVSECERLGIPWGAYLYSYAMSVSGVASEVSHAARLLSGKSRHIRFSLIWRMRTGTRRGTAAFRISRP